MILSTLHGPIPLDLQLVNDQQPSNTRHDICTLRGEVLGQTVNCRLMLDLETGELLLSSPDNFLGMFRLGDMVISNVASQIGRAQADLLHKAMEGGNAQAH